MSNKEFRVVKLEKGHFFVEFRNGNNGAWQMIDKSFKSATKANEYIAAHSDDAPIAVLVKAVEKPKPAVQATAKPKQQNTQQGRTVVCSSLAYMMQTKTAAVRVNDNIVIADVRELADRYVVLSIPMKSGGKLIEKVYI